MPSHASRESHEEHPIPGPTIWPFVMGLGITLLAAGLVTNFLVLGAGVVLFAAALLGWVRELVGEEQPGGGE